MPYIFDFVACVILVPDHAAISWMTLVWTGYNHNVHTNNVRNDKYPNKVFTRNA